MLKTIIILGSFAMIFLSRNAAAQTPTIPAQFQDASNDINTAISSFESTVNASWDGSAYPVLRSSVLQTATSDLTTSLLATGYYQGAVMSELNALEALGVKAVTIQINFPALYAPYYSDPSQYRPFLLSISS